MRTRSSTARGASEGSRLREIRQRDRCRLLRRGDELVRVAAHRYITLPRVSTFRPTKGLVHSEASAQRPELTFRLTCEGQRTYKKNFSAEHTGYWPNNSQPSLQKKKTNCLFLFSEFKCGHLSDDDNVLRNGSTGPRLSGTVCGVYNTRQTVSLCASDISHTYFLLTGSTEPSAAATHRPAASLNPPNNTERLVPEESTAQRRRILAFIASKHSLNPQVDDMRCHATKSAREQPDGRDKQLKASIWLAVASSNQ